MVECTNWGDVALFLGGAYVIVKIAEMIFVKWIFAQPAVKKALEKAGETK